MNKETLNQIDQTLNNEEFKKDLLQLFSRHNLDHLLKGLRFSDTTALNGGCLEGEEPAFVRKKGGGFELKCVPKRNR